ncbi:hypothetical protein C6P77_09190 [Burkholderia ambifaria]|nr:hypothetical protein C6P77_09190 [Burkholderia ambifaria]
MARRGGAWMTGYFGMARRHASRPSAKRAAGGGGCAVAAGVWRGIGRVLARLVVPRAAWGRRREAVSVARDPARAAAAAAWERPPAGRQRAA